MTIMTSAEYKFMRSYLTASYAWMGRNHEAIGVVTAKLKAAAMTAMANKEQTTPEMKFISLFLATTTPLVQHFDAVMTLIEQMDAQLIADQRPPTDKEVHDQVRDMLAKIKSNL